MKRLWQFLCRLKSVFALLFWMGALGLACATPPPDLSVDTLRSQTGTFPYDTVPSRALEDMNPSSKTFGTLQSAADYEGAVSVWYFTHATCSYCRSQYALLEQMHQEFEKVNLSTPVHILAVNGPAFEAGLELINAEGSRPVLQDLESVDLWGLWDITYRDVVVVNPNLVPIARLNLTTHDLADPSTYQALENLIRDVLERPDP